MISSRYAQNNPYHAGCRAHPNHTSAGYGPVARTSWLEPERSGTPEQARILVDWRCHRGSGAFFSGLPAEPQSVAGTQLVQPEIVFSGSQLSGSLPVTDVLISVTV